MLDWLRGRIRSFGFAGAGVAYVVRSQPNAWIHLVATFVAVGAGMHFDIARGEWLAVVLAIAGVWVAEALNTAFEALCDVASPEFHPQVEKAKDAAAGAVLLAALAAVAVAGFVFAPRLFA